MRRLLLVPLLALPALAQWPGPTNGATLLPSGWTLTPAGRHGVTSDYLLNVVEAPDGQAVVGLHCGFNPHGLVVLTPGTWEITQRVPLRSAWFGLAWNPQGSRLYVSGGNASGGSKPEAAPVYAFDYHDGRLAETPAARFAHHLPGTQVYWAGLAHHPKEPWL